MFKHLWPWSKIAQLETELANALNAFGQARMQISRGKASYERVADENLAIVRRYTALTSRAAEQERLLEKAFFQNPTTRRMMKKGVRP